MSVENYGLIPFPDYATITAYNLLNWWKYVSFLKGDECNPFTGHVSKTTGCGQFRLQGKNYYAHRVAWFFEYKEDPGENLVLHIRECKGGTICCNPRHLYLGDQTDNMEDPGALGYPGENARRKRFHDEQIQEIRDSPLSTSELAKIHGVHWDTIGKIRRGLRYWYV